MFSPARLGAFLQRLLRLALATILLLMALSVVVEVVTRLDAETPMLQDRGFWVAIPLNLLPAIVLSVLVFWLAGRYVQALYKLDSVMEGVRFILRSRFGMSSFGPWIKVEKGTITKGEDSIVATTGGPGNVIVYNDSAVVLEKDGRLTRVEGSGYVKLEPFERIFGIIDLRPKRWVVTVEAMTKDGIPISWDAEIHYQIVDNGQEPSEDAPYPFSKDAVFRAAINNYEFVGRDAKQDWEARIVVGRAMGSLRTILSRYYLNDLVGLTEQDARDARRLVQAELDGALRNAVTSLGAKLLAVKLDNFQVRDEITQQWIDAWRAGWHHWSTTTLAEGEAEQIRAYETAKAEAQMSLLVTIGKALEGVSHLDAVLPHMILNRLFSVLDRSSYTASSRIFYPNQAIDALNKMRSLIDDGKEKPPRLLPGEPAQEA